MGTRRMLNFYTAALRIYRAIKLDCVSTFSSGSTGLKHLQGQITVVPMPQLSPYMSSGKVVHWMKLPGDIISTYDVLFECQTTNLSEEAYRVGDFAGEVSMLVEAQDEGILARVLVAEGHEVAVHTPVAVMCEHTEDVAVLSDIDLSSQESEQWLKSARSITWQAYLKHRSAGGKGCD
eukprot:jgi/Botrbrau1/12208/Bobra.0197s0003.1